MPWELKRVVLAREPKARRMPVDTAWKHRGAALLLADGTVVLEAEAACDIGAPNQRLPRNVTIAVIFYGDAPAEREEPHEIP